MSKWMLTAGAAAIALATPTLADPGGKQGKNDRPAKAMKADRGGGKAHAEHRRDDDKRASRGGGDDRVQVRGRGRGDDDRRVVRVRDDDRVVIRDRDRDGDRRFVIFDDDDRRGLIDGCPPGLAKKDNGCMPPGQFKKMVGTALPLGLRASLLDGPYRQWYRDNDRYYYRNDGDFIYRVNRDGGLIDALIPYGDRDYYYYPVGMNYPTAYDYYNVPYQYRSYYPQGGDYDYRYGDGAIYRVDPQTNVIQSIVALLAGDLAVGQPLPTNYGVYNVPLTYRDRYYDTPDAMYRYNDGYIYRADPSTRLVTAVIDAIV